MESARGLSRSRTTVVDETQAWDPVVEIGGLPPGTERRSAGGSRRIVAGRYRLQRVLGRGGMGTVWLAEDESLRRTVAIKEFTLPAEVIDTAAATERVRVEACAAARVSHPCVVGVYDLAVEHGPPWIVMEALSGHTLAHEIRQRGRVEPALVWDIARQLVAALQAVHSEGLVHRDVKPGNVQLTSEGRVVLIDFGLAVRGGAPSAMRPGQLVGSLPFMAPESIREGRFTPASDLFALGATLYAAVEGRHRFHDLSAFSILEAVKTQDPLPAQHAGHLRPVIDGLLIKDPAARWNLETVQQYLSRRPVQSPSDGTISHRLRAVPRWASRRSADLAC
jgi:serine/threonine protein kinase